ncbi:unnamed protein product [Alopecurus aequalis]
MAWPSGTAEMVDERFYSPQPTDFTVTKSNTWRGTNIAVRNSAGESVMKVERAHTGYSNLRSKCILDAASRRPLITLVRTRSLQPRWEAFRGQSTSRTERLFVAMDRSRFIQRGVTFHVFLDGNSSSDGAPDFFAHCSYLGPMNVSRGGDNYVALIERETTSLPEEEGREHTYTVRINAGVDQLLVLALTVVHDSLTTEVS